MDVILLEKVGRLGGIGDKVAVKPGFGRNYLIPTGKAIFATPANIARFEQQRAELLRNAVDKLATAQARAEALDGLEALVVRAVAGQEGRLFGSVGAKDVADAATAAGVEVTKSEVRLPAGAIRELGTYAIDVQLHADVVRTLTVNVVAE